MVRITQFARKVGWIPAVLTFVAFVFAEFCYWFVFHHAPDSIVTPRLEADHRLIHLNEFYSLSLMVAATMFFLPATAIAVRRVCKNILLRLFLPPILALALLIGLFGHAAWLYAKWPPPLEAQAHNDANRH